MKSRQASELRRARPRVEQRLMAVRSFPSEDRAALSGNLARYLSDRSPHVRAEALERIGQGGLCEFEEKVIGLLSDSSFWVRMAAAECIGQLLEGENRSAPWLYPLLEDPNFLVRIETLESLAYICDRKSLPMVVLRLDDEAPLVRSYAAETIADLDGTRYVKALERASRQEVDERAKVGFACALYQFGDETQFSVLLQMLKSSSYTVRCAAANTISWLNLLPAELKLAYAAVSYGAQFPLGRADGSTMEQVLKELLEEDATLEARQN